MDEKPADAFRTKTDSSLVRAVRAVADGEADAVVSAGNTGAMLAAGLVYIRRIPGVRRPAIAVPIPARKGPSVLIDAGANADCRAEHLLQFATMGAVFAEEILDITRPTVRLLSIGEEPEKGNQLTLEARDLLVGLGSQFPRQRRGPRRPRGRSRRPRHGRLHGQRHAEGGRGDDQDAPRLAARGDHRLDGRNSRRFSHPSRREKAAQAPRPGHVRRRVSARATRACRDRARQLLAHRDRERDPARRARRRPRRRRPPRCAPAREGSGCMIGALSSPHNTTR